MICLTFRLLMLDSVTKKSIERKFRDYFESEVLFSGESIEEKKLMFESLKVAILLFFILLLLFIEELSKEVTLCPLPLEAPLARENISRKLSKYV